MTLMRRHSCRTEGVEGACVHLLFWLWRSHPALDSPQADGVQDAETNKALEAVRLQRGIEKPPVAVAGTWPSSTPVAGADRTRPVSWLRSISFGAHPRTKGARCFTGGHRRRAPSSPKGLLASRTQGARRPFGPDVESADQQAVCPAGQESTFNPPGDTSRRRGTCHCRRRGHAWDAPRVAGPCLNNRWKARLGQDVTGRRQEALGAVRRLRGAARLPPDDSIATVPLQSG